MMGVVRDGGDHRDDGDHNGWHGPGWVMGTAGMVGVMTEDGDHEGPWGP